MAVVDEQSEEQRRHQQCWQIGVQYCYSSDLGRAIVHHAAFADLGPALLFPTPLLVAECEGCLLLEAEGNRPADIDGDGEEVEELMPFVWMPGGTGRFALVETDVTAEEAEGAIFSVSATASPAVRGNTAMRRYPPTLLGGDVRSVHLERS